MEPIFILDRLVVRPGALSRCRELVRTGYLPQARERGMALVGCWTTPPVELDAAETELLLLWSLPGVETFWSMRGRASADPGVAAFWREIEGHLTSRERSVLAGQDLV